MSIFSNFFYILGLITFTSIIFVIAIILFMPLINAISLMLLTIVAAIKHKSFLKLKFWMILNVLIKDYLMFLNNPPTKIESTRYQWSGTFSWKIY